MKKEMKGHRCTFTGYLEGEKLAAAYASSDLFVFPSTSDTFGNVVLEAQASGLPVIVTDKGGPCENMVPDVTGVVVKGDSESALLEGMDNLVSKPERADTMGKNAVDYARTRSYEQAFEKYWNMYRQDTDKADREKGAARAEKNADVA
jgi:glycosyltransferase involved in cell wall biosynthesis